jgi:hypothetical protein
MAVFAVTAVACAKEKRVDPTEAAFTDFAKRVDEYVALRKHLADSIGPLDPTKSQMEIASRARTLANAIITARPAAKQGDVFTPEVAAIMATLIKQEYSRRPASVVETRGDQQEEVPDFVPKVNELYPTTYPLATFPPTLLPILPKLPEVVEYRIVNHYLILRDVEANLMIDFMPHAVPPQ